MLAPGQGLSLWLYDSFWIKESGKQVQGAGWCVGRVVNAPASPQSSLLQKKTVAQVQLQTAAAHMLLTTLPFL